MYAIKICIFKKDGLLPENSNNGELDLAPGFTSDIHT